MAVRRGPPLVQSIQASNQTLDRKFANATGDKRGNIRLLQPKHISSLGLGKLPTFDDPADFANKLGLEKLFFRVGKTKIGKDVAAACGHFFVVAHDLRRFPWFSWCASASFNRALISSISRFGVSIPFFDFFWKAWGAWGSWRAPPLYYPDDSGDAQSEYRDAHRQNNQPGRRQHNLVVSDMQSH
jgi:hypothetical protein